MPSSNTPPSSKRVLKWVLILAAAVCIAAVSIFVWGYYHALDFTETLEVASIRAGSGPNVYRVYSIDPGAMGADELQIRLVRPGNSDSAV
jgi:hypothetical protein